MKNFILGNKTLQKFWWTLYKLALKGLNYNRGHVPSANGEAYAIGYAVKQLKQNSSFTLFDIGANRGQYLEMALKKLQSLPQFRIFCFEPQKDAYLKLLSVAGENKNVITENMGLGSSAGKFTLYKDSPQSEMGSLYQSDYKQYNVQLKLTEDVDIITLDQYCAENSITHIDYLKIDVEGYEIEVLKGAANLIRANSISNIQFEFGLAAIESRIFLKDFFELLPNYDVYRILPNGLELINYSEYNELFLTTNYLSILKTQ